MSICAVCSAVQCSTPLCMDFVADTFLPHLTFLFFLLSFVEVPLWSAERRQNDLFEACSPAKVFPLAGLTERPPYRSPTAASHPPPCLLAKTFPSVPSLSCGTLARCFSVVRARPRS